MKIGLIVIAAAIAFSSCRSNDPKHLPAARSDPDPFGCENLIELARHLAGGPCTLTELPARSPLSQLTYDQYRDIRFNRKYDIWRDEQAPFFVEPLPAGFIYKNTVTVSLVENGKPRDVTGLAGMFETGRLTPRLQVDSLPLSGFRVLANQNPRSAGNEFLVFQGASYFRAVSRNTLYGLSARGLAIHTAQPEGEEFPVFTHFWIERPVPGAIGIVILALLDSRSTAGAYRFNVVPGVETVMDVDLTLFPRVPLDSVGIGTLTSMFLFGECDRCRVEDFRDAVHDSEGLLIISASGEQIWRALANPIALQTSSFTPVAPRAYGLIQRSRKLSDYQDFEAAYERRPSAWIEPKGDWGAGSVVLIEIPSEHESNDNIVVFWRPCKTIPAGKPWKASYRLTWTATPRISPEIGRAIATRCGRSLDGKNNFFAIDFDFKTGSLDGLRAEASTSVGKLTNIALQRNPLTFGIRASFELIPAAVKVADMRFRLMRGKEPASETWLYRWTAK